MMTPMRPLWRWLRPESGLQSAPRRCRRRRAARPMPPASSSDSTKMSMPFCQVRRLTTHGECRRPPRGRSAFPLRACWRGGCSGSWPCRWRQCPGHRPGSRPSVSMPLTMPLSTASARPQQAIETHAIVRRADFLGIGGADGRDGIGGCQTTLEEADTAVILDAIDGEGGGGQAEATRRSRRGTVPGRRCCGR